MIAQIANTQLTPEEYLAFEEKSLEKHEYVNGEVYAVEGSTGDHDTISINVAGAINYNLNHHFGISACRVYMADVKARLDVRNCYYYPDLQVTCEAKDLTDKTCKRYPKLIIEILSPSTEAFDRGQKFADYQTLESLEEYVLISANAKRVEVFRRLEGGLWLLQIYQENANTTDAITEAAIELKSIDFNPHSAL